MMRQSLFEKKLSASPRPFFLAAAAMILDGAISSLSEIGLDAGRLSAVVDAARGSDPDLTNALDMLTSAISGSRLPPSEVQPYADALARRRALNPYGPAMADFSSPWETEAILRGPASQVWLSCSAAEFSPQAAWAALADNPAAQESAIAHPEILLDQAINAGELPFIGQGSPASATLCKKLSAKLLAALAERMGSSEDSDDREAGARFACGALEILADQGQNEKAEAMARHAIKALSLESTLDPGGELLGQLATFAMGNEKTLAELARAASAIRILPSVHAGRRVEDPSHGFVFAPSGHGGLSFPQCLPGMDESFFTLAEYALAFGNGPDPDPMARKRSSNPDKFSPELEALSTKMRELGVAEAVEARGTPEALRELVMIQQAIDAGTQDPGRGSAALEAYAMMAQSSAPNSLNRARMRV